MSANQNLIDVIGAESIRLGLTRAHVVAMQWPELAVALADLMEEQGLHPPGPFCRAQREAREAGKNGD